MQPVAGEPLDVEALRRRRAGARLGAAIHYFDEIGSTNNEARERALAGCPEGTVVLAESQTRGRGRLGRSWVSPPYRNLYLSVVLRPTLDPAAVPQLALVAGWAAARAARAFGVDAVIKWPNDILADGRKVAGILAEMEAGPDGLAFVVLGIGVNVNLGLDELPDELRDKAGSLAAAAGRVLPRHEVAARLLAELEDGYTRFCTGGFAALRDEWNGLSCLAGRRVRIDDASGSYEGTVVGLADDGTLELRRDDGRSVHVVAGDVTVVGGYSPEPTALA